LPTAFISYSWDDEAHKSWVKELGSRLRADGVIVTLDQWATVPGDQLPAFMEQAIRENDFIIIVCTARYKVRSDARRGGGIENLSQSSVDGGVAAAPIKIIIIS
jgi:hypothetical protein